MFNKDHFRFFIEVTPELREALKKVRVFRSLPKRGGRGNQKLVFWQRQIGAKIVFPFEINFQNQN